MAYATEESTASVWYADDLCMVRSGAGICAQFNIGYRGQHSGKEYLEYVVRVYADGTWNCYKENAAHRWLETNGVCDGAEPLFKGMLAKAQALAILKG
jgi:hypothetical protein